MAAKRLKAATILGMGYVPSTEDLLRVMAILGVPGDPLTIMKDHAEERRRAELLAYVAAAVTEQVGAAETGAGLGVDDKVDLHWQAEQMNEMFLSSLAEKSCNGNS